jgi:hypothetical protein
LYVNPDTLDKRNAAFVIAHEMGHALEDRRIINKSRYMDAEVAADMFGVWQLQTWNNRNAAMGRSIEYRASVYDHSKSLIGHTLQRCGGDLPGCPGFKDALEKGDLEWFLKGVPEKDRETQRTLGRRDLRGG